jgi:peroxiredoxin family protein
METLFSEDHQVNMSRPISSNSNTKTTEIETNTEKDMTISNFEGGIDFLPDEPVKRDSPEFLKKVNFRKSQQKDSNDRIAKSFDMVKEAEQTSSPLVTQSTQDKTLFSKNLLNEKMTEEQKESIEVLKNDLIENSSLIYSCLTSYVGYYFSESENNRTTNSVLNKCLEGGKVNYPDLFLRFMD